MYVYTYTVFYMHLVQHSFIKFNSLAYKQYLSETGQAMKTLSVRSKNVIGIMIKAHRQSILCTG